jgi:hypothetical protein
MDTDYVSFIFVLENTLCSTLQKINKCSFLHYTKLTLPLNVVCISSTEAHIVTYRQYWCLKDLNAEGPKQLHSFYLQFLKNYVFFFSMEGLSAAVLSFRRSLKFYLKLLLQHFLTLYYCCTCIFSFGFASSHSGLCTCSSLCLDTLTSFTSACMQQSNMVPPEWTP